MISFSRSFANILTRIAFNNVGKSNISRTLQTTCTVNCKNQEEQSVSDVAGDVESSPENKELTDRELKLLLKDRSKIIPVETSIRYLQSEAYKETYGDQFVWEQYRRNYKGQFAPRKTRKTCIRSKVISTGNPCPICRDEYLVLDHRNLELLKQFISPQSGEVLSSFKTGLCQKKHFQLIVAVHKARDYGLLTFDVPFRNFDYSEYYDREVAAKN